MNVLLSLVFFSFSLLAQEPQEEADVNYNFACDLVDMEFLRPNQEA